METRRPVGSKILYLGVLCHRGRVALCGETCFLFSIFPLFLSIFTHAILEAPRLNLACPFEVGRRRGSEERFNLGASVFVCCIQIFPMANTRCLLWENFFFWLFFFFIFIKN